jgi:hypothetical protein
LHLHVSFSVYKFKHTSQQSWDAGSALAVI